MILDQFDEGLVLVFGVWLLAQGVLFGMIWQTSRISMVGRERTRLSRAQHDLAFGLVITFLSVGMLFLFRWLAGPMDDATWAYNPVRIATRLVLLIGLMITTWAGGRVFAALLERLEAFRTLDEVEEAVNVRQDARSESQDHRENAQNEEDHNLEIRRVQQDRREGRQDQRDRDQQGQ